jgi:hypothetical protein
MIMIEKKQLIEWLGADRAARIENTARGAIDRTLKRVNEQPLAVAGILALRAVGADPTREDLDLLNGKLNQRGGVKTVAPETESAPPPAVAAGTAPKDKK